MHYSHTAAGQLRTPKRNGAGAKGCWGTIMDQDGPAYVDRNDPNYDSDMDGDGFVLEELNLSRLRNEIHANDGNIKKEESSESGESQGSVAEVAKNMEVIDKEK